MSMFKIEFGAANDGEACEENGHDHHVLQGSLRIPTEAIVDHIENQGSFTRDCYESLEAADQQTVINHIATYAIALVAGLQAVKAERDGNNRASNKDASSVLLADLVKLRHGVFLKDVLDPF
ncbi:unnamed protein product [Sphagnum troendelagicum]|uniref:Uncharacterized protein n=1 Tax=Sphagnum troendelagicum TaxID=128251 RepID=A0ABP0UKR5_9BRYO